MKKKTIAIIGPEASGSRLVARTVAVWERVIESINEWDGTLIKVNEDKRIIHRSIPSGPHKYIIDIERLKESSSSLKIIFTTRDKNISQISRQNSDEEHLKWIEENKAAIKKTKELEISYFIFSYEALLLYESLYWFELLEFTKSDFIYIPRLVDGNRKYLK